ncbi:malonyl-CoA:anthocyanidin 5-O-glucoside-6''-O-malonyltransferase-like [Corylus avellana]|uniref:malonyl-CoA:anthocyanidin 5-O-glucoside-6''-O-malonyltransferase-like n=1 Tax=Corylus avellana TaxID=13451 RepID=UPI001E21B152|nr:malonyl-CoA:anthocyanidin 5-O-glucoside-6''-O-malonyltransferase-like [Corylus avellana]
MAPNNSVKILEVFRVSPPPTSPDSASPSSLPLTLFDIFWLRFPPVQRVFFYEISPTNAPFLDSILPKLKHSLSLTLQHYHPLAGTLTWSKDSHKPIINYIEGDSVSFTLAESSADFYNLSGNNCFVEAEEYHSLVPHLPTSHEQATVLSLQVTIFSNCGFCIGITAHHAVLDGKSSTMFMKSWAHLCKHGGDGLSVVPELTPSYDRTVIKDPAGLEGIFLNQWMNHGGPNNKSLKVWEVKAPLDVVRGTFELSLAKIQKLRQLIITTALEEKNEQKQPLLQLSTYTITCAYTWVCLAKAEGVRDAKFLLGINVDARRRMEAPIPATYFGNCIGSRASVAERNELLGEEGVAVAVKAIGEAITSLDDGVLIGAENWLPKVFAATTDGPRFVGIAGSPRFELYNTDFGWGRPRKVEMISIDGTGAMCLSDSREGGGGIEIGLVLKKQEMEVFASLFSRGLEAL